MTIEYLAPTADIDYVTEPVVHATHLVKDFNTGGDTFRALDSVSVKIQRGEMVAIMGPSGSGKSTLMTILGLLDTATSGQYWLDGADVSKLDRVQLAHMRNRKLGFIFQNFNLLPRLSALKNVELPLVYGRVGQQERELKAREALIAVGLESKLHSRPYELSGGQKQRVAVARALVGTPTMLLADEPTGALDTKTGTEIMGLFRQLNSDLGLTIIIVTHDPEIGRQMDRVIGLHDGALSDNILSEYYGVTAEPHAEPLEIVALKKGS